MIRKALVSLGCFIGMCGCASTSIPAARLADTQSELRAAETVGADKVPKAALYLQLAREGIDKAKKQADAGEVSRSDYTLQRAQADAELAIAVAKNEPLIEKSKAAKAQLEQLQADSVRSNAGQTPTN